MTPARQSVLPLVLAVLVLAGCGGGGSSTPAPLPPPPVVTVPDPMVYLAQSINPDGNTATPLTAAAPWGYERFDYGHYQASQSWLDNTAQAVTIWSYPPFGPFASNSANDGGEVYALQGSTVYITETQDGGQPGVLQQFGMNWPVFDTAVPPCSQGWETINPGPFQARACRQSVTFPGTGVPGGQITAATIISEHGQGQVERFYLGAGWGRLAWESWNVSCPNGPVDPARAPAISYDAAPTPGLVKCDERLVTNVSPAPDSALSGTVFGWSH